MDHMGVDYMRNRSDHLVPIILLIIGMMIFLGCFCSIVKADEAVVRDRFTFRQSVPAYIGTNYSNSSDYRSQDAPYVRTQIGQEMIGRPVGVGALDFRPVIGFVWRATNWPVGAISSPIEENNYLPSAGLHINARGANDQYALLQMSDGSVQEKWLWQEDTSGRWRGADLYWGHQSTGTDSISGSWDRVIGQTTFGFWMVVGNKRVDLTGTARGWYVINTGSETAGLLDYVNFKAWEDVGGEVDIAITVPELAHVVVNLGLSYQNYELYVPLAASWDISLFGQFHHGNFERMFNYRERPDAGIVGIAYTPVM